MAIPSKAWMSKMRAHDSKWEKRLCETIMKGCEYHPTPIHYTIEKHYEPDWRLGNLLIEAKGIFTDSVEASKYHWVRKALPEDQELVFLFQNPKTPLVWAKKRKDGTKMNHGEWAEYHRFRWFTEQTIGEIL
jgi:hypothetical protein